MNKVTLASAIVILTCSSIASANIVFFDNFSTFEPFDPANNPVVIYDDNAGGGQTMQWLNSTNTTHFPAGGEFGDGVVAVNTATAGQSRGLAYVWDPTQMGGTLIAADYTLEIAIFNQFNVSELEVSVFEGIRDDTGTANTYELDLLSATNSDLTHTTVGTGALNLLSTASWTSGSGVSGTLSLNFAYDGNDDLVLVMNQRTTASFSKQTTLESVTLSYGAIPEPSTYALFALGLAVTGWFYRRRV